MIIAYLPAGALANSASRKWKALPGAFKVRRTLTPCFVDSKQQFLNGDQAIGECGP